MKNLVFVLVASFMVAFASAQESGTIVFTPAVDDVRAQPHALSQLQMTNMSIALGRFSTYSSLYGAMESSGWYDMWNQNFINRSYGGVSQAYSFYVYPDSNLVDAISGLHLGVHGMGMSFDPTDSSYSYSNTNGGSCQIPISPAMNSGQGYTVDSFYAPVTYVRKGSSNSVDSIIIELFVTPISDTSVADSGAYTLSFHPAANLIPISYDSVARFATVHYNGNNMRSAVYSTEPNINDCYFDSVFSTKYRYGFELNSITVGDTDAYGFLDFTKLATGIPGSGALAITPIHVINSRYQYIVSFIKFKSGVHYPLGELTTTANFLKLYAGEPIGDSIWFMQSAHNVDIDYPGSYQAGLIANNTIRYNDDGYTYPYLTHDVLIPSSAYANSIPPRFDVPEQSFHIVTYNIPNSVQGNNNALHVVDAYPNPASDVLNITYTSANGAATVLTLYNVIGQVVATEQGYNGKVIFNTSGLASGMYIYSAQADGVQSVAGHVVIAR
jgi:hypothetical protein